MDSRPFNAFISMQDTELPVPGQHHQKPAYASVGATPTILLSTRLP